MTNKSYIAIVGVIGLLLGLYYFISQHPAGVDDGTGDSPTQASAPPPPLPPLSPQVITQHWSDLIAQADGPALGNPNAPYTLIEIGDFQCPQCGKIRPVVEHLLKDSNGQAKLYFINFPLQMHPHARFAAAAALAAAKQGYFWQMYNLLYSHQDELIPSEVQYYASQEIPGFNINKYLSNVSSPALAAQVQQQVNLVNSLDVTATPTLLVKHGTTGTPMSFVGAIDTATTKGITTLALSPPWKS